MTFFEPLPEREDAPPQTYVEHRSPAWTGPPINELPRPVALDVVLAQTERVAVFIGAATAYTTGVAFELSGLLRVPGDDEARILHGRPTAGDLRFGVAFADGRRTTLEEGWWEDADTAPAIHLGTGSGSSSGRRWDRSMWLWPLPPPGPVTFALSWTDAGVEETLVEVDSAPIRAAAERAVELWPDERPEPPRDGGGWAAYC